MNRERRREIKKLIADINDLPCRIARLAVEEQEAIDCVPDSLQDSDKYVDMQTAMDALDEAEEMMRDAFTDSDITLDDIIAKLQEASE